MKKTPTTVKRQGRKPIKPSGAYTPKRKNLKAKTILKTAPSASPLVQETSSLEIDLFRILMDSTTDLIYFKDLNSHIILINRSNAAWYGLSDPSEAVGKTDFDIFTEEHARQAYKDEQKIIATGEPLVGVEERETRLDGHETWFSTTKFPLRARKGRIIGTFGISRDITEHKRDEEARIAAATLREANVELEKYNTALQADIIERQQVEEELDRERNLLHELIDNLPDYIFAKDAEGRFTLGNIALAHHMGVNKPEDLYGKGDFDFYPPDLATRFHADEQALIHSGQMIIEHEESTRDPAGRPKLTLTTKVLLYDSQGKVIGLVGNSRDITERKDMELSLELANSKLAELVNWLEGRNREITILNEMGKLLEACRSLEEAYPVISSQMEKLIPIRAGTLYMLNGERGQLEVAASWGEDLSQADPFSPQDCRGIQSVRVYLVNITHPGSYCPHLRPGPGEEPISMCIPLIAQGETIGLLHLRDQREQGGPETLPDMKQQLAVTAADHITLALANLILRETLRVQSIRDGLTGLFNRRYLEESLLRELAHAKRKGTTLGVIMLDVDHLKQINDTFGHEAGDALLRGVGRWLQSNIRAEDISCRYGGDEFVLIMPDASLESTFLRAQQICKDIQRVEIGDQNQLPGCTTVSIGVAGFPERGESRDELLAAADAALYQAKAKGRSMAVLALKNTSTTQKKPFDQTE
jgi:diguanylate cyclase (GGDEF)-like protein/PAS domain S-box-containing protein